MLMPFRTLLARQQWMVLPGIQLCQAGDKLCLSCKVLKISNVILKKARNATLSIFFKKRAKNLIKSTQMKICGWGMNMKLVHGPVISVVKCVQVARFKSLL